MKDASKIYHYRKIIDPKIWKFYPAVRSILSSYLKGIEW